MHAGHNFGRIILKSGNWKKTFEVTARKFTAKEIARMTNTPLPMVKSRLRAARNTLSNELREDFE